MSPGSCYLARPRVERNAMVAVCLIGPAIPHRHHALCGGVAAHPATRHAESSPSHPVRSISWRSVRPWSRCARSAAWSSGTARSSWSAATLDTSRPRG